MPSNGKHPSVHLTTDSKDYLTVLPPELLHNICDHLLPNHDPQVALHSTPSTTSIAQPHALDHLSATCRSLRAEVQSWAHHFLRAHARITRYKELKTPKLQAKRNLLRGKGGLLTWAAKHCIFCGKSSNRSAILVSGLKCCAKCDKAQWPDKITKTAAKTTYDLKDHQLLGQAHSSAIHPQGSPPLPALRYGTYITSNVPTTMFLEPDVRARAQLIHGDLALHASRRAAAAAERQRKKAVKDQAAAAKERAWAAENTPFALAEREGRSKDEAIKMLGDLIAKSGLLPEEIMEAPGIESIKMALEMRNAGGPPRDGMQLEDMKAEGLVVVEGPGVDCECDWL
ncbi:hypothetical protein B0A50_00370 [Salinomyces thailandicus]|uniref:Uncharacterized protein n=1 Tax=Salinomyces thailandicus TaxID=706561 RepID=A0A4U0UGE8_9PEZI|nr:hypothetical protein B0A50_00370 [Salinomyces thailandica]